MTEIVQAILDFLRENGYTCEDEGKACVHVWKGPGRCRPVMYTLQFAGRIEQSACHQGDSSSNVNVWCQYTGKDDVPLGMFDTMRGFELEHPRFLELILEYLTHHDQNVHPVYGRELKYQREKRLG
jgi:hypothetical protein